jgi:hypothetical protein
MSTKYPINNHHKQQDDDPDPPYFFELADLRSVKRLVLFSLVIEVLFLICLFLLVFLEFILK